MTKRWKRSVYCSECSNSRRAVVISSIHHRQEQCGNLILILAGQSTSFYTLHTVGAQLPPLYTFHDAHKNKIAAIENAEKGIKSISANHVCQEGGAKGALDPSSPLPTNTTTLPCRDRKGLPPSRHNPADAHVANLAISRDQCICTLSLQKACHFRKTVLLQTMHRVQPARILLSYVSMWLLTFPKYSPNDLYLLEHTLI